MKQKIYQGDCIQLAQDLPDNSVDCIVTSPPYFQQRVYSDFVDPDEIGNEARVGDYVLTLKLLFEDLKPKLKDTGTLFLNLGDKYQNKHLLGVPWRVASSLSSDGWILRNCIVWSKPNPMPSSAKDRFTPAHEFIFFFTKRRSKYHFEQILEPATYAGVKRGGSKNRYEQNTAGMDAKIYDFRNKRDVWEIKPATANGAHTAVFPLEIPETCIKAGCPIDGVVLDPFAGLGTTGLAAKNLGRAFIGFELNPEFVEKGNARIASGQTPPMDLTKSYALTERASGYVDDESCVEDLVSAAVDVWREMSEEVENHNEQIRQALGVGLTLADIRRAEDPDGAVGFDEVVEFVQRNELFSLGHDEQEIFETLRAGYRLAPTLRDDEVWQRAMERAGV